MCPKCFLKTAGKPSNHQVFTQLSQILWQYLTQIIETKSIPGKNSGNSGMVHFAEINQAPPLYSILQYIGRVATPKPVPSNCFRYLQTILIMGGRGLVSEFMWGIVEPRSMASTAKREKTAHCRINVVRQVYYTEMMLRTTQIKV